MDQAPATAPANTYGFLYPGSTIRYDPDGMSIGADIPDDLLIRWKRMIERRDAEIRSIGRNYDRFYKMQEAYQRDLLQIIAKAGTLAATIDALADAIGATQDTDEAGAMLAKACPFILDCLDAIGTRLAALDDEAVAAAKRSGL